ncbi:MAG: uroporphyrinogen decarboxylase family protein [Verrucomicrobiae bacterium]|nr:uroporphyrinogen decarboxylase family protein [Verrucomicrobiae bacterium]
MTSLHHARVRAVFNGAIPDRLPICEQAFASSVASEILGREAFTGSTDIHYQEACAWLNGKNAHEEFVQKLFQDVVALHQALDFDIFFIPWRKDEPPTKRLDDYRILYGNPDGNDWSVYQFDPVSRTYGLVDSARGEPTFEEVCQHVRETLKNPPKIKTALEMFPLLNMALRECRDELVISGFSFMAVPMQKGWLEATVLEPALVADYLDVVMEGIQVDLAAQQQAGLWLINGGGDFAFNNGPIYSPKFFREVMLPRWKRTFDYCRKLGMKYIFRSDGNLWPIAVDLFGSAQPDAYYECDVDAGMIFSDLRRRFPNLVLMGNVSCASLLTSTPAEIREQTRQCIEAAQPRLVIASANAILHGTPVDNVLSMYDTAKNGRK